MFRNIKLNIFIFNLNSYFHWGGVHCPEQILVFENERLPRGEKWYLFSEGITNWREGVRAAILYHAEIDWVMVGACCVRSSFPL